jgi:hypothetical protein
MCRLREKPQPTARGCETNCLVWGIAHMTEWRQMSIEQGGMVMGWEQPWKLQKK